MNPRASITTVSDLHRMLYDEDMKPGALPLSVLSKITNNFSEELIIGSGGFAEVYKGIVENDLVAVKMLTEESMDEKEYKRELECLLSVKHKNIVRFLGYCGDTQWDMRIKKGKIVKSNKEKRLLCFESVPNGTLDSCIKDPSTGLAWSNRYKIIKGICEGLSYLHQINILHLDLKPGNILLGDNEVPKITDFGLSRYFREDKAYVTATKEFGTMGYMAPEFTSKQITQKFDLYSLGVVIIEIIMGKKGYQDVHEVLESWDNRLDKSQRNSEWEQIKVCAEIAIQCIDSNPANRPDSMKDIMDRLAKTESLHVIPAVGGQSELLEVHPPVLYFPFESNKVIPCSLHLTNNTKEHVAFRLMDRSNKSGPAFVTLPLCGLVPPRSTYTLVVTTEERNELERRNICMILKITILGDEYIDKFQSDTFFENVKEMGKEVQEVKLIGVHTTRQEIIPSKQPMSPKIKILDIGKWYKQNLGHKCYEMHSLDINHAKQWIITGGSQGHVGIWNYQTQRKVDSLRLTMYQDVISVKFIARKQCFVAMTEIGVIHVYQYEPIIKKITSMSAGHVHPYWRRINRNGFLSLAVHPTKPYLLAVSGIEIKLWDGDKGWECIQIFRVLGYRRGPYPVAFNPMDKIAIASDVNKVQVRSLDSPKNDYTMLCGHSDEVNYLNFFTSGDQEYLVTGSDDKTAKIWDMEKKICVYTLESLGSPSISVVVYQPNLQILMTGSNDGLIYLWSTTNSRICSLSPTLERIIDLRYGGDLQALACWMERVVIEKKGTVAVLDVENKNYQEETTEDIEALLTRNRASMQVMELLDVCPLELLFHRKPHDVRSLHLTNKTDEHVAFRVAKVLVDEDSDSWDYLPLYGTVHPRSTCHLIVITDQDNEIATEMDIVVQSSIIGDKNMVLLARPSECHEFFDQAKELGHVVHEVPMKFIYTPTQRETVFEPVIARTPMITSWMNMDGRLQCLDAHPTEPWIITGHRNGDAGLWNYDAQELLVQVHTLFKISDEPVMSVKFYARQHWIVAQTHDGLIHVYDYVCVTQIKKIATFGDLDPKPIRYSIAVNPIKPYVLSSSKSLMKLWDGDKGWECTQTFGSKSSQSFDPDDPPKSKCQAFNPDDPSSFADLSANEIVKSDSLCDPMIDVQVWSLDSSEPNYRLSGHLENVNCLAFFTCSDRQYLITGSDDFTAKIWDLQKKACIHTLEGFMSQVIHVISLPGRPYLVTCSRHGTIQVWSSIDFRLKTTVDFSSGEYVRGLACLMGSRRIAIGRGNSVSIMDIDHEEEAVAGEGNNEDSVCATGLSSNP